MSNQNREKAIRWFEQGWNARDESVVHELMLPGSIGHMTSGPIQGPAGFLPIRTEFLKAFPDMTLTVEDTCADENKVVVRWRFDGTHTGNGFGLAPSAKNITFVGMSWFRFQNGKIVEGWDGWDAGALFQTLGAN